MHGQAQAMQAYNDHKAMESAAPAVAEGVAGLPGVAQLLAALPFRAANLLIDHRAVVALMPHR